MTDRNGRFLLEGICPGSYMLRIESLPLDLIALAVEPCQVVIQGGRQTTVRMFAVPAAQVQGCIEWYDLPKDFGYRSQPAILQQSWEHIAGIKVVLRRREGPEEFVSRTNEAGQFSFRHLRPGSWLLAIESSFVPSTHVVEESMMSLMLSAGTTSEAVLHVVPAPQKPVQWIEDDDWDFSL